MEGAAWQEPRTEGLCRSGGAQVARARGEQWSGLGQICPLRSQCTFKLPLAWGLCVQGSEKEEARETEAIQGGQEVAEGAWRCIPGPDTAGYLALGQRSRTCFYKFRPMDLRQPRITLSELPLQPGQAGR